MGFGGRAGGKKIAPNGFKVIRNWINVGQGGFGGMRRGLMLGRGDLGGAAGEALAQVVVGGLGTGLLLLGQDLIFL